MGRARIGDVRREEILQAFEACVVRKGLAATTLADVAEEANQPRSLVRYFIGNRAEMVTLLIDRILERGTTRMGSLESRDLASSGALATFLLEQVFTDPTSNAAIMELWHLSLRDAPLRERIASIYDSLVFEIAAVLAQNGLEEKEARERAFAGVALSFGTAFFRHLGLAAPAEPQLHAFVRSVLQEAHCPVNRSEAPIHV